MKLSGFSFKNEAIWIAVFNFGLPLLGVVVVLVMMFLLYLKS